MQVTVQIPSIPPIPPIPTIPTIPQPPLPPEIVFQSGPPERVILATVFIVGIIVAGVILWPLIKAFARRIEGRTSDGALVQEVEQLRARVADLEQSQHRMAELEERVDFSERLLAQGREAAALERRER